MDVFTPARRGARITAVVTAAVLVLGLLPATAFATHTPNHGDPCRQATPADRFADYDAARDVHRASIDCAFYRAITSGAGTNAQGQPVYRPRADVTRAQMAQFIVNTLVSGGHDAQLPSGGGQDAFTDIAGSFARIAINRLARAGIISGTGNGGYSPSASISRQQMASFIVQAANWAVNPDVAADGGNRFTDVAPSNVHNRNIEAGADAGLFQGTSATTFAPGRLVVRDQMATFLVNLLRHVFDEARAPTPYSATAAVDDTTVDAGTNITGQVTGSNVRSVSVSGCGISTQQLADRDEVATGIQYLVGVPASQPQGTCALSFAVTFNNDSTHTSSIQMTVRPANQATVSLNQASVQPGGQISGQITGSNIASARVTGCGLSNEPVEDRNANQAGIQLTETIPSGQPTGSCTLSFTVTHVDNRTETVTAQLTVGAPPGATTRPELIHASIVSTTTTAQAGGNNPAGTVVRYVFDEPLQVVVGSQPFSVYRSDATRVSGGSDAPDIEPGGTSVLIRFASITTTAMAVDLTTAAVDDAVMDWQGQANPEGAVPLAAASGQAGTTAAPDLVTVGGLRAGAQANTTAVDFTFDETAFTLAPAGFHLVLTDNRVVDCTGPARESTAAGGGQTAGGNGTTRITVVCANPAGTQLTTATVARGFAAAGTVNDSQGPDNGTVPVHANPLQSADVGSGGITSGPDLQSLLTAPGAGTADPDIVIFAFDSDVAEAVIANRFVVYDVTGREYLGASAARQSGGGQNPRRVVVTFAADALDSAAGASVRDGAVTDGAAPGRPAEIGVAAPPPSGTPGITAAPDLVAVALTTTGTGSSQTTVATYTFDEDLNATSGTAQPARFLLYLANGTQLTCNGAFGSTFTIGTSGAARRQATCSSFQAAGGAATAAQVAGAVLGTVDHAAVDDADAGTQLNPEGAARTSGGTGTPAQ